MEEQKPTQETHPGAESTPAAGGNEAVTTTGGLTLEEINAITGRDYKDLETAKSSIKEMQQMAGKAADLEGKIKTLQDMPKTDEELRSKVAELSQAVEQNKLETFFAKNPDHADNRSLLERLAVSYGDISKAMESPEYKSVLEAQTVAKESQSKRTVADPSGRVGQAKPDTMPEPGDTTAAAEYVAQRFFAK